MNPPLITGDLQSIIIVGNLLLNVKRWPPLAICRMDVFSLLFTNEQAADSSTSCHPLFALPATRQMAGTDSEGKGRTLPRMGLLGKTCPGLRGSEGAPAHRRARSRGTRRQPDGENVHRR